MPPTSKISSQVPKEHIVPNLEKYFSIQLDSQTYYKNIELDAALGLLVLRYNQVPPNNPKLENKADKVLRTSETIQTTINPTIQQRKKLKNNQGSVSTVIFGRNNNKESKLYHSTPIIKKKNANKKHKKLFKTEKKEPLMIWCKNILKEFLEKTNSNKEI